MLLDVERSTPHAKETERCGTAGEGAVWHVDQDLGCIVDFQPLFACSFLRGKDPIARDSLREGARPLKTRLLTTSDHKIPSFNDQFTALQKFETTPKETSWEIGICGFAA
jgi:hypothetical protein